MKKSRFTDSQIITVLKRAEAGTPVPGLCRELEQIIKWRSAPRMIRCDNDPEYISGTMRAFAVARRIRLEYTATGWICRELACNAGPPRFVGGSPACGPEARGRVLRPTPAGIALSILQG
ncbi:MAG: hypothetical protein DDT26_01601 [Dehalococcoidia bacterium]|nr:hypothetical protein [Chloroflexota bacterium]